MQVLQSVPLKVFPINLGANKLKHSFVFNPVQLNVSIYQFLLSFLSA